MLLRHLLTPIGEMTAVGVGGPGDFGRSSTLRRLHVAFDPFANGVRRRIPRRRDRAGVSTRRSDMLLAVVVVAMVSLAECRLQSIRRLCSIAKHWSQMYTSYAASLVDHFGVN